MIQAVILSPLVFWHQYMLWGFLKRPSSEATPWNVSLITGISLSKKMHFPLLACTQSIMDKQEKYVERPNYSCSCEKERCGQKRNAVWQASNFNCYSINTVCGLTHTTPPSHSFWSLLGSIRQHPNLSKMN
jgi:hypothetical protein